jgi:glutamate racemase
VTSELPIGVFDSGVGGLTVLRAIRRLLPSESIVYLGDTARLPYGTKSAESVTRYAIQASDHLVHRGIKLLVIACNTASAISLDPLRDRFAPLPVVGVVEPGAAAAVAASRNKRFVVLATESTVNRHAYARAIQALAPGSHVDETACSLLVALAEEGWTEGEIPESVVRRYLAASKSGTDGEPPDTVVLGCTHFPLLEAAIRSSLGPAPTLVDSASTTAEAVARLLDQSNRRSTRQSEGEVTLLATDGADRFARVGSRFLNQPIKASDVEIVDL